jgi:hypothetical protein
MASEESIVKTEVCMFILNYRKFNELNDFFSADRNTLTICIVLVELLNNFMFA